MYPQELELEMRAAAESADEQLTSERAKFSKKARAPSPPVSRTFFFTCFVKWRA